MNSKSSHDCSLELLIQEKHRSTDNNKIAFKSRKNETSSFPLTQPSCLGKTTVMLGIVSLEVMPSS